MPWPEVRSSCCARTIGSDGLGRTDWDSTRWASEWPFRALPSPSPLTGWIIGTSPRLMFAEVVSPDRALAMGFLDEIVDDPFPRALSYAASLAALPKVPFAATKR